MKKLTLTVTTAVLLSTGLLGACGNTDDSGVNTQNMNRTNRTHMNSEGPVTDMMTPDDGYAGMRGNNYGTSYRGGTRGQNNSMNQGLKMDGTSVKRSSYENKNHMTGLSRGVTGNDRVGMIDENGMIYRGATRMETGNGKKLPRDSRFGVESRDGMKKHGAQSQMNYADDYDGETVEKVRSHVAGMDGVKDARVMSYDNQVVIAVMHDDNHKGDLTQDIENGVKDLTNGKDIRVLTDSEAFNRVQEADDKLRNGEAFDNVRDTVNDMMKDLGDAAKRPFEGMRR
ncbi:YhcN/YlaJ family sporulation lipoprotein [Alkalicoccobacillus plakortidis]|uniref:YhcN/YlaJ family sporulation lipoprotein n=1 Tax=Alkalicoccobacillus plakortidis TaxID=444060 RepID=A0ABT0XL64_9BACI|nr:YhcN/YlaJ family sporulation lipoprotein [Alkalicoccobacillus plakortidis]MCM2676651.1 YhcN/YlaJ family sporulation lipoprotein [Alkalicoccobacillus plakortidis]